mmetsp:Transcript_112722/g.323922  ORF Transcript_112722/g.323922 Transcript_112722/m.323922 type:complete len:491 (+) Transcript_112722:184-1656(+)
MMEASEAMEEGAALRGGDSDLPEDERRNRIKLLQEVANISDEHTARQLLSTAEWNVEEAVQIALGAGSFAAQNPWPAAAPPAGNAAEQGASWHGLGAPLLQPVAGTARSFQQSAAAGAAAIAAPLGFRAWLRQGLRRLGDLVVEFVRGFVYRAGGGGGAVQGGHWFGGNAVTGQGLRRALVAAYGGQLELPRFFDGTFMEALDAARAELKLLVVFLHSSGAPRSEEFCTRVLADQNVRQMLDENFVLWGGDAASPSVRGVVRLTRTREYPSLSVLLPAAVDDIQLINSMSGQAELDMAVALLTACMDDMQMHRAAIVARTEQFAEDRQLREQQDREYQEALEADRKRAEEQALQEQRQREEEQQAREEAEALEAKCREREESLRRRARELAEAGEGPEATARISLRLPAGQRIDRKFSPEAPLETVYSWAEVAPYMPENEGKGLVVPERFKLTSSFPSRELTERERTVAELNLAGSALLLAEVEDEEAEP